MTDCKHHSTSFQRLAMIAAVCLVCAAAPRLSPAQSALFEREPFDRITIASKEGDVPYEIEPLDLPGRRIPDGIEPTKRLSLNMLDRPGEVYEVLWRSVRGIEFFEEMVLREAESQYIDTRPEDQRQTPFEPDYVRAYDYYDFLLRQYPNTPRLERSLQVYLYLNTGHAFNEGRDAVALGMLEELYRRNPEFSYTGAGNSVVASLSRVSDRIVETYVANDNFASARLLLTRLGKEYGANRIPSVVKWRNQLSARAAQVRDQIQSLLAAGKLRQAHEQSVEMRRIWPDVEGGREILLTLSQRYPVIVVGVAQPAAHADPTSIDDRASRRIGRLLHRSFFEFLGEGPEGGQYASPLGSLQRSDDGLEMTIRVSRGAELSKGVEITGLHVARRLRALADPADPSYLPAWAGLMQSVSVDGIYNVRVQLRRPHVLPEAMLQLPLVQFWSAQQEQTGFGPFVVDDAQPGLTRYAANPNYAFASPGQPAEVIERSFDDWEQAISALRSGRIDVLDHIFPADAPRLARDNSLTVAQYAFPTIHLLAPNHNKPFTANKLFRRALVYGIDRERVLNKVLLRDAKIPGCRVVSGPFSPGISSDDALSYAYDESIQARGVDRRLAKTLLLLAQGEIAKKASPEAVAAGVKLAELPPLVLAHPAAEAPRLACQAIAAELEMIGLQITLKEMRPGAETDSDADLVYVEAAMWEPAIDAGRLLGAGGVFRSSDPYVGLALRELYQATNWQDVGAELKALHRDVYNELPIVPLWQVVDHFAFRRDVRGLEDRPVTLYQDIEQWRLAPRITTTAGLP